MSVSLILAVAIAMVFLYLLGSQVVLSIYELWAGYTNSRGKFLYRKLKGVLGPATTQALYAEKPIAVLTPPDQAPPETRPENSQQQPENTQPKSISAALDLTVDNPSRIKWWLGIDGLPAYVPASLFASTLLAMIKPSATKQADVMTALKDAFTFEDVAKNARIAVGKASAETDAAQATAAKLLAEASDARTAAITTRKEATMARTAATTVRADAVEARADAGTEPAKMTEAAAIEHKAVLAETNAVALEGDAALAEAKAARAESDAALAKDKATAAENAVATAKAAAATAEKNIPAWFSSQLDELLTKLLDGLNAEASLEDCQKRVAAWYDDYGERLTGWYKRQVRVWLFLIGLVVAFVGNIDSPFILCYLWAHPQLSSSIADTATQQAQAINAAKLKADEDKALELRNTVAAATTIEALPIRQAYTIDSLKRRVQVSQAQIQVLTNHLHGLGFPIGRADSAGRDSARLPNVFYVRQPERTVRQGRILEKIPPYYLRYTRHDTSAIATVPGIKSTSFKWLKKPMPIKSVSEQDLQAPHDHSEPTPWYEPVFGPQSQSAGRTVLGWLLTALALSVGAPFWFDLLCRLVNIRNLGIKPPRPEQ